MILNVGQQTDIRLIIYGVLFMYYAAPLPEGEGDFAVYMMKRTIREMGEHFVKHPYGNDPEQTYVVYRGKPSNIKNFLGLYHVKNGKFKRAPSTVAMLINELFS